ncbi:E3 ubiquitin-protein ligase listerin, putative [Rhizoctonia solani AG-3 Rhs1AP]|uniref:E3 ubiquitin-protein ligase listerin n=1 Tax=Rhizoctonia solani AG-3 Rhs1AP TaxID=1086054 RepID=X8J015_9AGAM|nr:E3 ubiquitin-protein ligase listerin, putative [Rhizoctonia solani AG-3 Rhs1AP]
MGKQGKSSASSATRKKHAKKAATHDPSIAIAPSASKAQGKGKGKGKNKEPRVKQYIPPPKYKPLVEDPIESSKIASVLPPNVVLCFKGLSKKDPVTKTKALDELGNTLDDECWRAALPVWLWHFVSLSVHPNRRLRELSATLHSRLLEQPGIRDEVQSYTLREPNAGTFIAAWALGANDIIPSISKPLKASWSSNIAWYTTAPESQLIDIQDHLDDLISALLQAIVDPEQLYHQLAPLLAHFSKESPDAEDLGEHSQDRNARIRTAGLNSIAWILEGPPTIAHLTMLQSLRELLSSTPSVGTVLSAQSSILSASANTQSSAIAWGHEQRAVRMAGWKFVKTMVKYLHNPTEPEENVDDDAPLSLTLGFLRSFGAAAIRSAWTETDAAVRTSVWDGFLPLITAFPDVWNIAPIEHSSTGTSGLGEVDSDGDDDSEDSIDTTTDPATSSHITTTYGGLAFSDFLRFLELGCQGSAIQSYPVVVIVLSTIPEPVFSYEHSDLERLFTSFWAAYDGKALNVLPRDKESTMKAFLSSLLDCVVFISRKLHTRPIAPPLLKDRAATQLDDAPELVPLKWIAHILQELVHGDLDQNVSLDAAGELIGISMKKLELISLDTTRLAWRVAWEPIFIRQPPHRTENMIQLLAKMRVAALGGITPDIIDTILRRKALVGDNLAEGIDPTAEQARVLISLWSFLDGVAATWLVEVTGQAMNPEVLDYLVLSGNTRGIANLMNGYLNAPTTPETSRSTVWSRFLNTCVRAEAFTVLRGALDSVEIHTIVAPDEGSALFDISKSWATDLAGGNTVHNVDLGALITHWKICLSQTQVWEILEIILSSFVTHAEELLFSSKNQAAPAVIESIAHVFTLILVHNDREFFGWTNLDFVGMSAFLIIIPTLPETSLNLAPFVQCSKALRSWSAHAPTELQLLGGVRAKEVMRNILVSCNTPLSAQDIVMVATQSALYLDEKMILLEMFPPQSDFDRDLDDLNDNPSPLLAEYDPLIRLYEREPDSVTLIAYDIDGFSQYARVGVALATLLSEDRHLARDNLWTFRHLLALQQLCSDFVSAISWPSDVFRAGSSDQVHALLGILAPLVIYLGNSLLADHPVEWHQDVISRLSERGSDLITVRDAQDLVYQYYSIALRASSSSRDPRLLRRTMQFVLRDAETDILDRWSGFAQLAYTQHPSAGDAIGSIIAARGIESPRLDRWRNDVASRIPSVPIGNVNQAGLPLLRTLNCLAPPLDSGIIFMPQQRAIYLVQALQKWMSSDEELDSSMEALVTALLNHLIPILQTVRGAHWEFILDILETNLSVEATVTNLYILLQTLRAISAVLELIHSNQQLKEIWTPRQHEIFQGVLQLFLTSGSDAELSETHARYYSCLAEVIQALPSKQIQPTLFDELLSLVSSRSIPVKVTAHYLARNAVAQITEQRVLEAAISVPPEAYEESDLAIRSNFDLPPTLIERLSLLIAAEDDLVKVSTLNQNARTMVNSSILQIDLLLAWWLVLDFFDNASLKVKQGYLDQLRKLSLVKSSLLPCLFGLLNIGVVGEKPFNLAPWSVNEFYLSFYDQSSACAQNVLAAHIYFKSLKAIPGLIRTWYSECQDRQLSASISAYTKAYFSPVLISQELEQFRSSAASASDALADDTFALKVAPSVNEITASYAVDEQEAFEVAVRIPSEFPLRAAEVKDVRGVAGMENRRRAWLFGVQNTIQQGLIYDALVMYKKNVAGHFEGKSECAICYSLISVTDRTLPTKPCRTCKNLFHASCLYKWFNTSHTSSCPLCRSDIF